MSTELSHQVGPTTPDLIERTIGADLEHTVERFPDR